MKKDFNNLIIERLGHLFQYNLQVIDQYKGYIKLKSPYTVIVLAYNEREKANYFYIGRNENNLILVDDNIMLEVFNSSIKIDSLPLEVFIANLNYFFQAEGQSLLLGGREHLAALEKFVDEISSEYTEKLMKNELLKIADNEWEKGNYKNFIKYLERMNLENLLPSYQLKYKVARRKIKE